MIAGAVLLLAGVAGLVGLYGAPAFVAGMMGGGMVMGREGMKAMMQRMMGDALPPGIDPALLPDPNAPGASLLARYCSQCHNLPGPGLHTAQEWPAVIQRMSRRMRMMSGRGMMGMMMGGVESPDDAELQVIVRYLQAYAQRLLNKERYNDLETPAGRAFQSTCALCHALPDPQQHTASEWPGVVARMKKNMIAMGKSVPDVAIMGGIVGFLQRHAKPGE